MSATTIPFAEAHRRRRHAPRHRHLRVDATVSEVAAAMAGAQDPLRRRRRRHPAQRRRAPDAGACSPTSTSWPRWPAATTAAAAGNLADSDVP